MDFQVIGPESKVYPGEYLLHQPTQEIVLCGAYVKIEGKIRAMRQGRLMEDKVENFRKIQLNRQEQKDQCLKKCGRCKTK